MVRFGTTARQSVTASIYHDYNKDSLHQGILLMISDF